MKLIQVPAPDFDLAKTLDSGQVFHWEKAGAGFVGTIGDRTVYVEQQGNTLRAAINALELDRLDRSSFRRVISHYFALDHPLSEIYASFPDDAVIGAAKEFCRGLRIIRQPQWECLATFICSSMKQVAHIRQISQKLRERFGDARAIDGYVVRTFPSVKIIAATSEKELRKCALGYRAKNLLATARLIASGDVDLEELGTFSDVD